MKFNKAKCKVLHLSWGNPKQNTGWVKNGLRAALRRNWGVVVDKKLDKAQQCAVQKANCVLGCIQNSVASRAREVVSSLYSALMRPHPEHCVQLWGFQQKKDVELLQQVQRGIAKMIKGLEHLYHEDRWRNLELSILENRLLWRDHTVSFQCLKGAYRKAGEEFFKRTCNNRTWGNGFKMKEYRFGLVIRNKFFTIRMVKHWNRLPGEVVVVPSLKVFKPSWMRLAAARFSERRPMPMAGSLK
ncbi:hypothetical protein DUI87_16069 [Hirundo rustica rustica]|uniref:Uncharacterized protein n=1 Tax=Hirundo rustica rustica TaxID=333673 RepID=A0A3M0K2L3_HIRRU|nr:hypothetical protein DUI87_16069 [Hirundo rustica rustica]